MGVLYKAEDTKLGRKGHSALEAVAQDHQAVERFQRQARSASALDLIPSPPRPLSRVGRWEPKSIEFLEGQMSRSGRIYQGCIYREIQE